MHWWQSAFSSPSSSTPSSARSQPEERSAFKTDLASLLSRSRGISLHSEERRRRCLTRAKKLRHLTDDDVGFNSEHTSSAGSSHPLPLPELADLLRRDARRDAPSNSSSKYVPLPSSQQPIKKTRDEKAKSDSENRDTTRAFSMLTNPDNQRNKEFTQSQRSPKEQTSTERVKPNYKVNIHCSCSASPLGSSAVSPESTGDIFTPYYLSPPAIQVWSAPELPPTDRTRGLGLPYPISPERYTFSYEGSPLHSPKISPRPNIRSPRNSTSPLHNSPKISPRQSTMTKTPNSPLHKVSSAERRNSNAPATVHPLPLPPGAAVPSLANPPFKVKAKAEVPPMNSQWKKGKLIGRGTFGSVYVASNRETGALCAMKEVQLLPDDPKCAESIKQLEQEIKVLSQLKHPNIVQYYDSEIVGDRFYIYLEYVHPGSINNYIRDHCGAISEPVVRNFTRHILSGLAYLHSKKTIHRDIKGANLLVDANGVVKLADFGMAKHWSVQQHTVVCSLFLTVPDPTHTGAEILIILTQLSAQAGNLSLKGSPYWMAPELLQSGIQKDASPPDHALAVDIWSLGCTIIQMMNGKPPWSECEGAAALFKVMTETPQIPESLSPEGKDFLLWCFLRNPAARPSASMLLEHRFLKNSLQLDVPSCTHLLNGMTLKDKPRPQRMSFKYKYDQLPLPMETPSMQGKLSNNEKKQGNVHETSNLMVVPPSPSSTLMGLPCLSPSCSSHGTGHPLPSSVAILPSYSEQASAWRN